MKKSTKIKSMMMVLLTASFLGGCADSTNNTVETKAIAENETKTVTESVEVKQNQEQEQSTVEEETSKAAEEAINEEIPMERKTMAEMTAKDVVDEMKVGWNLGNTLDAKNEWVPIDSEPAKWETAWGNVVVTQELIDLIADKGFNVIRIPVTWDEHIYRDDNYRIEESWMNRVQEIVDYAYSKGDMYVILNAHHESWYYPYYDNEQKGSEMLTAVWNQIADRFKDYDEHLIFEGMNEPRKVDTEVEWNGGDKEGWDVVNTFNSVFVDTIRNSGGNNPDRILMIPSYAANCWTSYKYLKIPENDDKIIVSIHCYEPYEFCLKMDGRSEWNEDTHNINQIMQNICLQFVAKGIPVVIGEFGSMKRNGDTNEADRAACASYFVSKAAKYGIKCCWWDNGSFAGNGERFGLIDRKANTWKFESIADAIIDATK